MTNNKHTILKMALGGYCYGIVYQSIKLFTNSDRNIGGQLQDPGSPVLYLREFIDKLDNLFFNANAKIEAYDPTQISSLASLSAILIYSLVYAVAFIIITLIVLKIKK